MLLVKAARPACRPQARPCQYPKKLSPSAFPYIFQRFPLILSGLRRIGPEKSVELIQVKASMLKEFYQQSSSQ
jgi:hypothetical protein